MKKLSLAVLLLVLSGISLAQIKVCKTPSSIATIVWGETDFESGTIDHPFGIPGGTNCTVTTAIAHSGTHSVICTASDAGEAHVDDDMGLFSSAPPNPALDSVSSTGVYIRWYVLLPSATTTAIANNGQIKLHLARADDTGIPYGWSMIGVGPSFPCTAPHTQFTGLEDELTQLMTGGCTGVDSIDNGWHALEVHYLKNASGGMGHIDFWVDGVLKVSDWQSSTMGWTTTTDKMTARFGIAYTESALSYPVSVYIDDIRISNQYNGP